MLVCLCARAFGELACSRALHVYVRSKVLGACVLALLGVLFLSSLLFISIVKFQQQSHLTAVTIYMHCYIEHTFYLYFDINLKSYILKPI